MQTNHFPNEEDVKYKKIYGGLSWPGKRPGFCVIVGELKQPQGAIKFVLLDEAEDFDVQELIKLAAALDFYYKPERWYTDGENLAAMRLVSEHNNAMGIQKDARRLRLTNSNLRGLKEKVFTYLFPRLNRMASEGGSLDISNGKKILQYMAEPQPGDVTSIGWGEFPSIESLAFAVFELDRHKNISKASRFAKHDSIKI